MDAVFIRATILGCSLLPLGCSETGTTPAGPLTEVDLRTQLPAGVTIPDALSEHEAVLAVCDVADDPFDPVGVQIIWHAFGTAEGDAHIVDYAVSLSTPSEGALVSMTGEPSIGSINLDPGAPWVAVALVSVGCKRETFVFPKKYEHSLIDQIQVVADGQVLDGTAFE